MAQAAAKKAKATAARTSAAAPKTAKAPVARTSAAAKRRTAEIGDATLATIAGCRPTVASRHLPVLRFAGLVEGHRHGQRVVYRCAAGMSVRCSARRCSMPTIRSAARLGPAGSRRSRRALWLIAVCSGLPLRHRVEVRILATFVGVLLALAPTGSLSAGTVQ